MNIKAQQTQWPDQPPSDAVMLAMIRSILEHSERVGWSDHYFERCEERGIYYDDVIQVLKNGLIIGGVKPGKNSNEWKCKLTYPSRYPGSKKEIGVAVVTLRNDRLLVMTAEWEDV